jgi:PAS domain S-box-containing protein
MYYSDRWWQMLGYRSGELAADEGLWQRLLHPDDAGRMAAALARAVDEGPDAFEVEFRLRAADGRYVPVLARGFVTRGADGRAVRMSGVNTDLTERHGHEAARRQLEAQLRESQKMESIGTLAGGIAHDFNNLLGAILANAALARADVADRPAVQESLAQIEKAGARARTLVQQILSFSRRQAPDMRVQPLRPLVEEALSILRATLPARVDIASQLSEQPLHVAADATQLQQVLMNLCTNAWHALQGGAGRVTVGLDASGWPALAPADPAGPVAAGPCAHLWVQDTGRGMGPETLQRVFEPFFTTKAVGQGTGLGLSVAHGIVSAHDGVIRAESEAGGGSCFHVYLPLRPPNDVAAAEAAPPGIRAHGRGELVVYVDDDEVMVHVVDRLLARLGYRTRCFTDGREALAVLDGGLAADLVVSDYNMPGLSGLELASALRTARPGLPVVMSSGFISDALREAASRAGVRALMHKQHTIDELGATIERVLGR